MAQIRRAEGQIEIKSQGDKFFDVWARKTHLISKWCPEKYPLIELNEGSEWHSVGAVTTWHYVAYGHKGTVTCRVTKIDESSMTVWYSYIDGYLMKNYYKSINSKFQVIPKGESCIVKWNFEYEKMKESDPDAQIYIDFLLSCAKDIDAHLCNA